MQATAQNPTVARLLGIPVERMILYTFLINAALVALASVLVTPIYLAKFSNGEWLGLVRLHRGDRRRLQPGARRASSAAFCSAWSTISPPPISRRSTGCAMPLLILIVVILFRPQGLLGRLEERTV